MATETKILPDRRRISELSPVKNAGGTLTQGRNSAQALDWKVSQTGVIEIVLCHSGSDRPWVAKFSERVRREGVENRKSGITLKSVESSNASGIVEEVERCLRSSHFFAIVISKSMLQTDWSSVEKILDVPGAKGRIVTILKDNVSLPASLRVREWIDFRDDETFEESVQDLLALLRDDSASHDATGVKERIVSNLFPVVEIPKIVFSAETPFRTESEVMEACGGPGPLPFLLRESRLYAFQPPTHDSIFGPALSSGATPAQENFTRWFSDSERAGWAISILNILFRHHAWKRGLRFDEDRKLYYFTRSKPKNVWWQIGRQTIQREVTAPHTGWIHLGDQAKAEVQYGWRHLSIRAEFIQVLGAPFLLLEPGWHLTMLDGKTSATTQPVGPVLSRSKEQGRNGQVLRSLRFWSVVLAKGHQELRINTGTNPLRARLTPLSGFNRLGMQSDLMDYDRLMLAAMQDDLSIPELGPVEQ